jgi:hypothetical protein
MLYYVAPETTFPASSLDNIDTLPTKESTSIRNWKRNSFKTFLSPTTKGRALSGIPSINNLNDEANTAKKETVIEKIESDEVLKPTKDRVMRDQAGPQQVNTLSNELERLTDAYNNGLLTRDEFRVLKAQVRITLIAISAVLTYRDRQ